MRDKLNISELRKESKLENNYDLYELFIVDDDFDYCYFYTEEELRRVPHMYSFGFSEKPSHSQLELWRGETLDGIKIEKR